MPRDASITFIVGRRGSGKTTQAELRLRRERRVVVFAPILGDYQRGFAQLRSLRGVKDHMRRNWQRGFRIAYRPPERLELVDVLDQLAELLRKVQRPYADGRAAQQLTLAVDEANLAFPPSRPGQSGQAFKWACLQGRHYGINIVAITQRPTLVDPSLRDNADEWLVFPLGGDNALGVVLQAVGRRHAEAIRALSNHHYLEFADGQVSAGLNPRISPVTE